MTDVPISMTDYVFGTSIGANEKIYVQAQTDGKVGIQNSFFDVQLGAYIDATTGIVRLTPTSGAPYGSYGLLNEPTVASKNTTVRGFVKCDTDGNVWIHATGGTTRQGDIKILGVGL